jgi:hypothetical protein
MARTTSEFILYIIKFNLKMNLFDEMGSVSPRTEGGMNRQKFKDQHEEIIEPTLLPSLEKEKESAQKEEVPQGWTRFIKLAYY